MKGHILDLTNHPSHQFSRRRVDQILYDAPSTIDELRVRAEFHLNTIVRLIKGLPSIFFLRVLVNTCSARELCQKLPELIEQCKVKYLWLGYLEDSTRRHSDWDLDWQTFFDACGKLEILVCRVGCTPRNGSYREMDSFVRMIKSSHIQAIYLGYVVLSREQLVCVLQALREACHIVEFRMEVFDVFDKWFKDQVYRALVGHVSLQTAKFCLSQSCDAWIEQILDTACSKRSRVLSLMMVWCTNEIGMFTAGHRDIIRYLGAYL